MLYTAENQLVIPEAMVEQLISEHHNHTGHFGIRRIVARIKQRYWFKGMEVKVTQHVKNCDVCQRVKPRYGKPVGKLSPLPVPTKPW